jgi:hypothetical protein
MAACLITVTGTSGIIKVDYKISAIDYSIQTSIGSFYIDDTATDVTYTTITGDLVATSGCLTITELSANYYLLSWKGISADNYKTASILLGSEEIVLPEVSFPITGKNLPPAVNNLEDVRVSIIGFKIVFLGYNPIPEYGYEQNYIFKVLGTDIPILKVKNADDTSYIYIYGESTSSTLPSGYIAVEPCYSSIVTTTTTFAP